MNQHARFDAPFWLAIMVGVVALGAMGCFGFAAATREGAPGEPSVVSVDDS